MPTLTIDGLTSGLAARPSGPELVRRFVPPSRFASKRFDDYRPDPAYPSQARALGRLRELAASLHRGAAARHRLLGRIRALLLDRRPRGSGVYLDGGFGVGKTHLLAALWHAAPEPRSYLSFDELVYAVGLLGVQGVRDAFATHRLIAVDEWELDDPGNLRMALAFLRGALENGVCVVTTSNTLPDALGRGRFPQKDFRAELEELADAFEVVRITGDDYRRRRFLEAEEQADDDGHELFHSPDGLNEAVAGLDGNVPLLELDALLGELERVHPIRYGALVERIDGLAVHGLRTIAAPPRALRWVHFIDKLYDAARPLIASSDVPLRRLFPPALVDGPYGKKLSRCLSRLTELLREGRSMAASGRLPSNGPHPLAGSDRECRGHGGSGDGRGDREAHSRSSASSESV